MIVVVDYGVGNLSSIGNMLKKIGAEAIISSDRNVIASADKLILPGVGAFDNGIQNLKDRNLVDVLNERVLGAKVPILGICLGMQLLTKSSEEGKLPGLGWIEAETKKFSLELVNSSLKIPHMGWNFVEVLREDSYLFSDMPEESRFYFVHSYHVVCSNPSDVVALTKHGYQFSSVVQKGNILGVQFHPEKSHKFGMKLLKNFSESVAC